MSDPVIIAAYDPEWPAQFARLGKALRRVLGSTALRIDHVGSTAVPGLDAKPILDIQISVAALEPVTAYSLAIEGLLFSWQPDNPDRTKRYFREIPGARRTHIHVRKAGSWGEQLTLLFRDYLRAHEQEARSYADLKHHLARLYHQDRQRYTDEKGPLIWQIVTRAHVWSQETGWEPGPSDA